MQSLFERKQSAQTTEASENVGINASCKQQRLAKIYPSKTTSDLCYDVHNFALIDR